MIRVLVLASLCGIAFGATAGDWTYDAAHTGPAKWKDANAECGKDAQSPIDLKAAECNDKLTEITLTGFSSDNGNVNCANVGNGVKCTLNSGMTVDLPNVEGKFKALQFHFHWGTDGTKGSEHIVDGAAYPAEMHIVCQNTAYATVDAALLKADGLAVLGFFMKSASADNANWDKFFNALNETVHPNNSTNVANFKMSDMMLPAEDMKTYFRYQGSLTTPPCSEAVTWTVFSKPVDIGAAQLAKLRGLTLNSYMTNNFRPVQVLGARKLYGSKSTICTGGATELVTSLVLIVASFAATKLF